MERLLTGYVGDFNRRHNRHGHLFQNRYKSILCHADPDVLDAAQEKMETVSLYCQKGLDLDWVARTAADLLQTDLTELWRGGKKSTTVQVRSLVCYWETQELGMTATAVGKRLKITQSGGCRAAQRGEQLAAERGWRLKLMINA